MTLVYREDVIAALQDIARIARERTVAKFADLPLDHGVELGARGCDLGVEPLPCCGIALHVGEPRHRLLARNPRNVLQGGDHVILVDQRHAACLI